jgi:hypothetical protein
MKDVVKQTWSKLTLPKYNDVSSFYINIESWSWIDETWDFYYTYCIMHSVLFIFYYAYSWLEHNILTVMSSPCLFLAHHLISIVISIFGIQFSSCQQCVSQSFPSFSFSFSFSFFPHFSFLLESSWFLTVCISCVTLMLMMVFSDAPSIPHSLPI